MTATECTYCGYEHDVSVCATRCKLCGDLGGESTTAGHAHLECAEAYDIGEDLPDTAEKRAAWRREVECQRCGGSGKCRECREDYADATEYARESREGR